MWKLGRIAFRREEPGNQDWENKSKIGTDVETSMYEALQVGVCRDPKSGGARIRHQGSSEKLYKQLVTRGHGTNMATDSQCWNQKEHATSVFFLFFFIVYAITVVPTFSSFAHLHPAPTPPQAITTPLSMSVGHGVIEIQLTFAVCLLCQILF